jgi:pimeloyl-ACP methyl ester carboxylesterase
MRTSLLLALAAGLSLPIADELSAQSPSGCWSGTIGTGARQRRFAIELSQSGTVWQGRYHRLERAIESGSLTGITLRGDSIQFTATGAPGDPAFTGSVETNHIKGTMAGRAPEPFTLSRVSPAAAPSRLHGSWFGWLSQGSTPVMRIGLNLLSAPCQQLQITMDSPDQGSNALPVSSVTTAGDSLWFSMLYINGAFVGSLNGDSLIGQWTQGGGTLELRLGRRDSTVSIRRSQEPVPPFPYRSTDVSYTNPEDSTRLAGTLTVPEGAGPFPAVLLITGSGAQDRNESLMGHKPFLVIADYLTRRGVAVLRVDDRGVGGSSGNTFAATIADNAGDALAGVQFLKSQPGIDPARIGLVGHSEGGWVAPLAASRSRDIAFIVLIAGPSVTGEAIRDVQDSLLAIAGGGSLNQVAASRKIREAMHAALKSEPNDSLAIGTMVAAVASAYTALSPALRAAVDSAGDTPDSATMADRLRPVASPWYRYLLAFDPAPYLRQLRIPVLALYGEKDLQVPPAQSAPLMERLLRENRRARVQVFPGLNHLFQHANTGAITEYGQIDETFSVETLRVIGDFIVSQAAAR